MPLSNIIDLAKNDQLTGHFLIQPCLWYGRKVQELTAPFTTPERSWERLVDISKRASLLVLVIIFPLVAAVFALGIVVKHLAPVKPTTTDDQPLDAPIERDHRLLDAQMDAILQNVPSIHGEPGQRLLAGIEKFKQTYKLEDSPTTYKDVQHLHKLALDLKEIKQGLFFIEAQKEPIMGADGIMRVPSDGNCFFHSLGRGLITLEQQLKQRGGWIETDLLNHEDFRARISLWMFAKMDTDRVLKGYIDEAIEAFVEVKTQKYQEERTTLLNIASEGLDVSKALAALDIEEETLKALQNPVDKYRVYLDRIGRPGFFASNAERYAVSQLYQVTIKVVRQIGHQIIEGFDPDIVPYANCPLSLTLVHVDGKHFDLKIETAT